MLDKAPNKRVADFLAAFGKALSTGDLDKAVSLFQDDCYWRDLVSFTWNIRTMEGKDQVRDMLKSQLALVKPSHWAIAEGEDAVKANGIVEGWLTFETEVARGFGHVRLKDGRVWTLLTTMSELKGHEEPLGPARPLGIPGRAEVGRKTWQEERAQEATELGHSRQPYCLIIGGGQGGNRPRGAPETAQRADHHRGEERTGRRQLAQALQVALPARSGLVRPYAVFAVPEELAGLFAEGQDRRLAGNVHQGHGAQLLGLDRVQERVL